MGGEWAYGGGGFHGSVRQLREGNNTFTFEERTSSKHENRISDDDIDRLGGMILTEFFCNSCKFISDNSEDLKNHYQLLHQSNDKSTRAEDQA